jgi:hypothetical protein
LLICLKSCLFTLNGWLAHVLVPCHHDDHVSSSGVAQLAMAYSFVNWHVMDQVA